MIKYVLGILLMGTVGIALSAGEPIWQLGTPDGSEREFTPYYNAWEYGDAPDIQQSPAMDHATHTFLYEIAENKAVPRPPVVSGLATESEENWMKADEIVSGLKLVWNETESGNRRLDLNLVNWSNPMKGKEGVEVDFPGGGKKRFSLPDGAGKSGEPLKFTAVFPVKSGKNPLTIRIISMAKHYRLQFDNIVLSKTDAAPDSLPVILKSSFNAPDGIYHPGDKAELAIQAFNLPGGKGSVHYELEDGYGKTLKSGGIDLTGSVGKLPLPTEQRGYFKLKCDAGGLKFESAFVVIEPVKAEYVPDSRFGAHALSADGYRNRNWNEYQETKMRRAFLAGVKWIRHHSMHWFLREPEKGKYDWTYFDDRLELAEKYKMNFLLTFGGVPEWASSSGDKNLTVCGTYRYQNSPPKEWKDWSDFIGTVVSRYKGRIKWYELWNEPGFTSAFWCNGSAKDYATLLKTGYEAAKKADPDCVVVSGAPLTVDFMDAVVRENGGKLYSDVMSVHYLGNAARESARLKSWKMVMNQIGAADTPIINSEEMGWTSATGELDKASTMVKAYVREAAAGIEKTFAFDLFCTGSIFHASAFDYAGNVLPIYAAYRTMTHRLEHAKFVGDLSTAETEAYLFDRQGTPVVVVWGEKAKPVELPFGPKPVVGIDLMDAETACKTTNGVWKARGETLPRFFEGGELAVLTEYATVMRAIPGTLVTGPGKRVERTFRLSSRIADLKWNLPDRWQGTVNSAGMTISVPASASAGVYEINIGLTLDGMNLAVPLLVEVSGGVPGENLVENGDFSRSTSYWFGPADKARFKLLEGAGVNGGNAVRTKGTVYFGCAGSIKVREGEKYALIVEARGQGRFGGVYSILDKNGKTLFPQRQGINCLNGTAGADWKTFCEEIVILPPDAATLKFSLLANYGDANGNEIDFNRVGIVRLTDNSTFDKAVWQGICTRTSGMPRDWRKIPAMTVNSADRVVNSGNPEWSGKGDLSASCQLAMDANFLYLRFEVADQAHKPVGGEVEEGWKYDSVQFAIDPAMEGKDRTEILIAEDAGGKAFACKYSNFWTPELPENLTRRGLMPDVKVNVEKSAGKAVYTVMVPLRELYPLSAKAGEFGFSWLVNDNDGAGRKYIQWSSGIGPSKTPALFGLVRVK